MTTSTLTAYESGYAVGRQHVHFDGRSSTPTTGAMNDRDAQCYWRVVNAAGDAFVARANMVLDYGWLGTDGQTLYMMAVDSAGNKGAWSTYTFSVAADTSADVVRYLSTTGSDSNDGLSSGSPWLTIGHTKTQMAAAIGVGEVGVVLVAGGGSYSASAQAWDGGSTARCIRWVWDGTSTKPTFSFAVDSNGFEVGMRGAVQVENINLTSLGLTGVNTPGALSVARFGGAVGDRVGFDSYLLGCAITGWSMGVIVQDNTITNANREDGYFDHIAVQECDFSGSPDYDLFGFQFARYWLFRDNTHTSPGTGFNNPCRLYNMGAGYAENVLFDTGAGTFSRVRLVAEAGEECRLQSWVNVTSLDSEEYAGHIEFQPEAGVAGGSTIRDIRFVNCKAYRARFTIAADNAATNHIEATRIDYINCTAAAFAVEASTAGTHTSVRFRDCAAIRTYQDGYFLTVSGAAARYASGCFQVHGCYVYWPQTGGFDGNASFYAAAGMTAADFAAKVSASNYNHVSKETTGTANWLQASGGGVTRSSWNSSYGFDGNSVVSNTTANITNNGVATWQNLDVHMASDSGALSGTGYPRASGVAIDADGYLRDTSTPDAGPFEFGASALPDDPALAPSPVLVSIAITPNTPAIVLPGTQQFICTGTYDDASTADLTTSVAWSSGTPGVATINASTGLATGVAPGVTIITADAGGGITDTETLTVVAVSAGTSAVPPLPLRHVNNEHGHAHVHTGTTSALDLPNPAGALMVLASTGAITVTHSDGTSFTETLPLNVEIELDIRSIQLADAGTRVLLLW